MAPHSAYIEVSKTSDLKEKEADAERFKDSGSLDRYESIECTPIIGTEFPKLQLSEILEDDDKLRDLAIKVSQRGVVFFRNQKITVSHQKTLIGKLGVLSGKPKTSKFHKHPIYNTTAYDKQEKDDELSLLSSDSNRKYYPYRFDRNHAFASNNWHTDIPYEKVPSDYGILQMQTLPKDACGGDTLWASGYELYDRLSPPIQNLTETLQVIHSQKEHLEQLAKETGAVLLGNRGAPENTGDLVATHPLVRTNPVTGWKTLFGCGTSIRDYSFQGLTTVESQMLKEYFAKLLSQNHDLQVRFQWGENDIAVWDNRSTYHTATYDYDSGDRTGTRILSLGEVPFYDPDSKSRRTALAN